MVNRLSILFLSILFDVYYHWFDLNCNPAKPRLRASIPRTQELFRKTLSKVFVVPYFPVRRYQNQGFGPEGFWLRTGPDIINFRDRIKALTKTLVGGAPKALFALLLPALAGEAGAERHRKKFASER